MRKLSSIALVGIAIVLATVSFGFAAPSRGGGGGVHGGGGFHGGGPAVRSGPAFHASRPGFHGSPGFHGHPGVHGHFDGHHFHNHGRVFVGGAFVAAPFFWPYAAYPYPYTYSYDPGYAYQAPAQSYWYYCPSYGAYYPSVQTCPEAWVPVPAQ